MSESDGDSAGKQFEATEQKLRKAREKGDFPRSNEVNALLAYLGALVAGGIALSWAVPSWITVVAVTWQGIGAGNTVPSASAQTTIGLDVAGALWVLAALFLIGLLALPALVILTGLLMQRGLVFVPDKLAPKLSRINPVKNAGQKFGGTGLVTFAISASKAIAVGTGGWFLFRALVPQLAFPRDSSAWVSGLPHILLQALLLAVAVSLVFAVLDLLWKHVDFRRRNRMSLKEMKDEMKDSEGDPHMKAARRQRSVDIAMSPMLAEVESADVVIVNPTHYAVALKWTRGSGHAPICVAKGVDEVAMRIRERARKHDVPIWPDPPSARALYATVGLGDEIRRDHFAAVAAAIRFAESMRDKARRGW